MSYESSSKFDFRDFSLCLYVAEITFFLKLAGNNFRLGGYRENCSKLKCEGPVNEFLR